MRFWVELFDYNSNFEIFKAVVVELGISVIDLETPFWDVNNFVFQFADFVDVAASSEIANAFGSEHGFDEMVGIAYYSLGDNFC